MILNSGWVHKKAKQYYGNIHTIEGSIIRTLEYILQCQWFFEKVGVKYFMTTFMEIFKREAEPHLHKPDIKYLYELIDFSKFLNIGGCCEWVKEHYPDRGFNRDIDIHPTEFGHKKFVERVVIPYIDKTKLISETEYRENKRRVL